MKISEWKLPTFVVLGVLGWLALHETGHALCRLRMGIPIDFWSLMAVGTWEELCGMRSDMTPARAVCSLMGPAVDVGALALVLGLGLTRIPWCEKWCLRVAIGVNAIAVCILPVVWGLAAMKPNFDESDDLPKAAQMFWPDPVGGHAFTAAYFLVLLALVSIGIARLHSQLGTWRATLKMVRLLLGAGLLGHFVAAFTQ